MTRIKPAQEPQTPNMARKGEFLERVGLDFPCFSEADVAEAGGAPGGELLSARSQLKKRGPFAVRLMYAEAPKRRMKRAVRADGLLYRRSNITADD